MTASEGVSQLSLFSPRVQLSAIEIEAFVGLWLLSGLAARSAWALAVVLYSGLAIVSLYLGAVGQPSCGCFGRVEVSPWASLALDIACVGSLALSRPAAASGLLWAGWPTAGRTAAVVLAVLGAILLMTSRPAGRHFARLRGESLWLESDSDAGAAAFGEVRYVAVTVENVSANDVHLLGGTPTCACLATDDLPITVPAGGRISVRVAIKYTGQPGEFKHSYYWHTDAPSQPLMAGHVTGRVE